MTVYRVSVITIFRCVNDGVTASCQGAVLPAGWWCRGKAGEGSIGVERAVVTFVIPIFDSISAHGELTTLIAGAALVAVEHTVITCFAGVDDTVSTACSFACGSATVGLGV